jgi:hypothetical protein
MLRPAWHARPPLGYGAAMSQMADHENERPVEVEGVPAGEEISPADAAERLDETPEEQSNRRDPVWDDDEHED